MSSAPRIQTNWLQAHYEKLLVVMLLVALLASAVFLWRQLEWERTQILEAAWERPYASPVGVQPVDLSGYAGLREAFFSPYTLKPRTNRLFVSERRVYCIQCGKPIRFDATTCPFCGTQQPERKDPTKVDSDGDGIPDILEVKYGLNPLDPSDAARDADQDGFTNAEEIQFGTDPANAASYPPPVVKLRMLRAERVPFKLRFQGQGTLPTGEVVYQVNLRSLERTYFVRIGDVVEGFEVVEYKPDAAEGPTLVIKQGENVIPLMLAREIVEQELVADVFSLLDRTRYRVRIGDSIQVKEYTYIVVDIKRDGVLLREQKSGKETLVGRLTEAERMALQSGGMAEGFRR